MKAPDNKRFKRFKRGVSMMEMVIAMAIIGVMITLAVTASVLGLKNQRNSSYRILAANAAGEMYAAFSRTYYYDGFYGGDFSQTTADERAEKFVNAYNSEVAAGLELYGFSVTISGGAVSGGTREVVMDTFSYYTNTDPTDTESYEQVVLNTRYITLESSSDAYKFVYTYYYVTVDFDEDENTYTPTQQFYVTAEIDLTTGYRAVISANVNGYTNTVFEQETAYET